MKNGKSKTIAFLGVMSAVIFVVLLLETQVFSVILPISPCFLSLPLSISLCIWGGWKKMFIGGTIIGCCSFIMSFMFPQFIAFANPLISILPRVLFGIVAFGVYKGVKKITAKSENKFLNSILPDSIAGITGAVVNTVLVVTMLFLFKFTGIEDAIAVVLSVNAVTEIVCSAILVPIIAGTIRKYYRVDQKDEEE